MLIKNIKVPEGIGLQGINIKTTKSVFDPSTINVEYDYRELESTSPLGVISIDAEKQVNNYTPAKCGSGVEIEGFLFIPEEIQGDETYRKREFQRTKIMSGGQFVSRTAYVPREYSFTCYFDVEPEEPYYYDKVFTEMQNKRCKVISPYISSNPFYAAVKIQKTHPKNSPGTIKVDVKLTEIPDAVLRIEGDANIEYPSTTSLSEAVIKVVEDKENTESDTSSQPSKDSLKYNYDYKYIDPNKKEQL